MNRSFQASVSMIIIAVLLCCGGCMTEFPTKVEPSAAKSKTKQVSQIKQAVSIEDGKANVSGKLFGPQVDLDEATFNGQLWLTEDGGLSNSSIVIFLFLEGKGMDSIPAGKTFEVNADDQHAIAPHLHCRYPGEDGEIQVEVITREYDMKLRFGELDGKHLPGSFEFSVPGEETSIKGEFRARVWDNMFEEK